MIFLISSDIISFHIIIKPFQEKHQKDNTKILLYNLLAEKYIKIYNIFIQCWIIYILYTKM